MTTTTSHTALQHSSEDWKDYARYAETKKVAARNAMTTAFLGKQEADYARAETDWFDWQFEMNRCYFNASVAEGVNNGMDVSYFGEFNDGKGR